MTITVFTMLFLNTAETILAFDNIVKTRQNTNIVIKISDIMENEKIYEDENTGFTFKFGIEKGGQAFKKGEVYLIDTNIGEFFTIENNETLEVPVEDSNKEEILKAYIYAEQLNNKIKVKFKISKDIDATEIMGAIKSVNKFKTNNNLVEDSKEFVEKTITIGNASKNIAIYKKKEKSGTGNNPDPVDIDVLWKNAWSTNNNLGSVTSIEVNPIGSMDLYGSMVATGDKERELVYHENFIVKDEITEKGYIDEDSMKIYAVVPTITKATEDKTYNGWYDVKKGNYYAQREGSQK